MLTSHKPRKSLGQHFLMHRAIAARIVGASGVGMGDTVLEVGPGTGILTQELLRVVGEKGRVVAVEADADLVDALTTERAYELASGRLVLVHDDIRTFDLSVLPSSYAVVANIPYYLTGELFRFFLTAEHQPNSMTFLVQKEVAERIAREKKESILSLSVKAYGTPTYLFTVPRGAFRPAPAVDSAVLHIADISRKNFASKDEETRFFSLVRAGFAHKRKLLRNNLAALVPEATLSAAEVSENARAEDLSCSAWLNLTRQTTQQTV